MVMGDGQAFNKHQCNAIQNDLRDIRQLCKQCKQCKQCKVKQKESSELFTQPISKSKERDGVVGDA